MIELENNFEKQIQRFFVMFPMSQIAIYIVIRLTEFSKWDLYIREESTDRSMKPGTKKDLGFSFFLAGSFLFLQTF